MNGLAKNGLENNEKSRLKNDGRKQPLSVERRSVISDRDFSLFSRRRSVRKKSTSKSPR
jgi:hypothetical protein